MLGAADPPGLGATRYPSERTIAAARQPALGSAAGRLACSSGGGLVELSMPLTSAHCYIFNSCSCPSMASRPVLPFIRKGSERARAATKLHILTHRECATLVVQWLCRLTTGLHIACGHGHSPRESAALVGQAHCNAARAAGVVVRYLHHGRMGGQEGSLNKPTLLGASGLAL